MKKNPKIDGKRTRRGHVVVPAPSTHKIIHEEYTRESKAGINTPITGKRSLKSK